MIRPQRFIFIGILAGIATIVLLATHLTRPVEAGSVSTEPAEASVAVEKESEAAKQPFVNEETSQGQSCSLPGSYPESVQQWCHLIEQNAQEYGLDARLLAALILQESGGQADAYSASGAVGLMQVMPRDGLAAAFQCINGPCFASRPSINELLDPQFNIEFGSKMLSNLYNKHGNWRDALLYYGPMDMGYRYADIVLTIYESYQ